jgi:high-affinity nickel-transport protein
MNFAYGWAFSKPVRKIYYNITITGLSVMVALLIGTVELIQVLSEKLSLTGPFFDRVNNLDFNLIGYLIVAMFVLTWAAAFAVWRLGHIEERWSMHLTDTEAT